MKYHFYTNLLNIKSKVGGPVITTEDPQLVTIVNEVNLLEHYVFPSKGYQRMFHTKEEYLEWLEEK